MGRKNARNSDVLREARDITSPRVYELLLEIVNSNREDLAKLVLKIDYLLEYATTCVKQRDFKEAKATLLKARERMDKIKSEGIEVNALEYLYEGIEKKIK